MKKRLLSVALALVMLLSMMPAVSAAGDAAVSLHVSLGPSPDTMDPAMNSDAGTATILGHLFSGLAKWTPGPNGNPVIEPDAAASLPEGKVNADGTVTYTYTLREIEWSNGRPVTAADFAFSWKRAAASTTGADYGYLFEVVEGYPDALAVTAKDSKTLEVTLRAETPYWNELLTFPAFYPVYEGAVANENWAASANTYVSNGLYTMASWEQDGLMHLTKNEDHPDAEAVTVDELYFHPSDDANNMLTNFINGDFQFIEQVPNDKLQEVVSKYPNEFMSVGELGTYYFNWNVNVSLLPEGSSLSGAAAERANEEIRYALSLLIDRSYICNDLFGTGQTPAASFVAMGMLDYDGSQFYKNAGHSRDYLGYYNVSADAYADNRAQAIEILKKYYTYNEATGKFTDIPDLEYSFNTMDEHKAIGEYVQAAWAQIGLNLQLTNFEWTTFLNNRKEGVYDIARNGWISDYTDPISFLNMWTTESGNNDVQFGKDAHENLAAYSLDLTDYGYDIKVTNGTWAETYDVLIDTVINCTDRETRYALMHLAEDMLMATGCIVPLYYYTDVYMAADDLSGLFVSPLGFKSFARCTYDVVEEQAAANRIFGNNRSATAIASANVLKAERNVEKFDSVILASGTNFADALAGSYLAAVKGAPILLHTNTTAGDNQDYITENLAADGTVYILGGASAVPRDVEDNLTEAGITVKRLYGNDRFATNLAILEEAGVPEGTEILVSTGYNFADSLSASATGLPILLVNSKSGKLTADQQAWLEKMSEDGDLLLTIVGGVGAVGENLEAALGAYGNVDRIYGNNRYETSLYISRVFFPDCDTIFVAYGKNFPDGLSGGPLAYTMGAPLLLVAKGEEHYAASWVTDRGVEKVYVLGGTGVVSDTSVDKIVG